MKYYDILHYKERPALSSCLILLGLIIVLNIIGTVIGLALATTFTSLRFNDLVQYNELTRIIPNGWWAMIVIIGLTSLLTFIGSGLIYWYFLEKKTWADFNPNKTINPLLVIFVILAQLTFSPALGTIQAFNEKLKLPSSLHKLESLMQSMENSMKETTDFITNFSGIPSLIVAILVIGIIAGIGEELIFRGLIQRKLFRASKNPHLAIWISALIFSTIHFQFYGFFPRLILGAMFGYFYFWSANLWVPILGHIFNNSLAVVVTHLISLKLVSPDVENMDKVPIMALSFSTLLFCGILYLFHQKAKEIN